MKGGSITAGLSQRVAMATKYTRRAEDGGWLAVKLTKGGVLTSLCEYTKVDVLRESGGRTFFKIADGNMSVGEEASLKTDNAAKYLADIGSSGAATVIVT